MKSSIGVALGLGLVMALAKAAPALQPDLAQGKKLAETVCASCHTVDGNSAAPIYPIIAGQHVEYLQKQLQEFKLGKRVDNVMRPWALTLSDQDIIDVSTYYASQTLKPRAATNQELVDKGEKIYRGGILEKHVPACAACHSPTGSGIAAQYPQLGSQHAGYTEAQLQAFKKASRTNDPISMMRTIAGRLSDDEIKAVAEYISGLR